MRRAVSSGRAGVDLRHPGRIRDSDARPGGIERHLPHRLAIGRPFNLGERRWNFRPLRSGDHCIHREIGFGKRHRARRIRSHAHGIRPATEESGKRNPRPRQRQDEQRQRDPEAEQVMQIGIGVAMSPPAQAARPSANSRPPQPQSGNARHQHRHTDPPDNLSSDAWHQHRPVNNVHRTDQAGAAISVIQNARGRRVEPHRRPRGRPLQRLPRAGRACRDDDWATIFVRQRQGDDPLLGC